MASLEGKTVLITGCNSGIGKETALELARKGARIVMACRNIEKAERVRQEIILQTKNPNVAFYQLDLASLQSVREFSEEYRLAEDRLDILINNAGVFKKERTMSLDGHELHFATNYLGHFLLTLLLLEKIKACAPSRIVIVSSKMHEKHAFNFDDIESSNNYNSSEAYSRSKTALILLSRYLAENLRGSGVTVYAVHPGVVVTEMQRDFPIFQNRLVRCLFSCGMCVCACQRVISAEKAAQNVMYCCTDSSIANHSGRYYENCQEHRARDYATDLDKAKRLWELSMDMCESVKPQ